MIKRKVKMDLADNLRDAVEIICQHRHDYDYDFRPDLEQRLDRLLDEIDAVRSAIELGDDVPAKVRKRVDVDLEKGKIERRRLCYPKLTTVA